METATSTVDAAEILKVLRQHGRGSLAYSALQEGMKWYYKPNIGFVQYEPLEGLVHNAAILGDPICAPESVPAMLDDFIAHFPDPLFIHVSKDVAKVLEARGFYINEMGVETLIDIKEFTLSGSKKEFLRSQKNRATKDGVRVVELKDADVSNEQLKHISEEWMHKKAVHDHELAFLIRPAVFAEEPDVRKFVALHNGEVIGFVFFDPMYKDGTVVGYMANILRTLGQRSYSITDFIIVEALSKFKEEGIEELSLGYSPFSSVADDGEFNYSKPLQNLFKYTYEHANHLYSFKSLAFHKERYRPDQPGARQVKVYSATTHQLPVFMLYGVFRKMGIKPITQTCEHAIHGVEEMVKHVPDEFRKLIKHWKHEHGTENVEAAK